MQIFRKILAIVVVSGATAIAPSGASAWYPDQIITTITDVIVFQNGESRALIRAASGDICYFDTEATSGKAILSAALAAYLSGRNVNLTCYDAITSIAGFDSHQLHRFWMM